MVRALPKASETGATEEQPPVDVGNTTRDRMQKREKKQGRETGGEASPEPKQQHMQYTKIKNTD